MGLTWQHVDLGDRPRLRVREQFYKGKRKRLKTSNGRRDIPLSAGMAAKLRGHRARAYRGEDRPVFASKRGTELYPANVARVVLDTPAIDLGLGWVTFHTFRHTCASLLFAEGRNVKMVQSWLGHADPAFTLRRYVHLLDEGIGGAEFFDRAVSEDGAGASASHPVLDTGGRVGGPEAVDFTGSRTTASHGKRNFPAAGESSRPSALPLSG